jgi:hypothetical protein
MNFSPTRPQTEKARAQMTKIHMQWLKNKAAHPGQ